MTDQIKKNKKELWEEMESLCDSPITYNNAQRIITCHKAYKILCEMADGHVGHNQAEHGARADHQLTEAMAKTWTGSMENADGTNGAHWPMEKTEEIRRQRGVAAAPLEWWVAMNMMYSDYCMAAEKLGTNSAEFYACMAKAFLDDKDAQPDKLSKYYQFVVRHT